MTTDYLVTIFITSSTSRKKVLNALMIHDTPQLPFIHILKKKMASEHIVLVWRGQKNLKMWKKILKIRDQHMCSVNSYEYPSSQGSKNKTDKVWTDEKLTKLSILTKLGPSILRIMPHLAQISSGT